MKGKLLFFVLVSGFFISLYANDTFFYIAGGNIVPADQNQTNVEMKEETINIELFDDYYFITVDFIFTNNGQDENLLVGFPYLSEGGQAKGEASSIYEFKTLVNDVLAEHSNNSVKTSEDGRYEKIMNYAFTRNVYFPYCK